jgi:type IV secretion system protein VirD4
VSDFSAQTLMRGFHKHRQEAVEAAENTKTVRGTAEFASVTETAKAGGAGALLTGRTSNGLLSYGGNGHLLTFAPTGAGKGVSVVVPNLMAYPGSVVCIDPKGAIAAVTAKSRHNRGQEVVLLDPFNAAEDAMQATGQRDLWAALPRSTYNPFSRLDPKSRYIVDDVRVIAGSLIVQGDSKNRFFTDSARAVLEGLILYQLASNGRLTTDTLLQMAFATRETYEKVLLADMRRLGKEFGGKLERLANQIEDFLTGEMGASVWSTLRQNLGLLDTNALRDVMQSSALDFRALKDKPTTIYLVLPAHALETHGVWLRLMLAVILRELSDARVPDYPVLFMVDECATLGRLEILETAVGLMRGYGMKLWLIFQDLPQLKSLYDNRWSSFISNSGVKQFFNVNDLETAEFVSKYLGEKTLNVQSESMSGKTQVAGSNISATGRRLLTPDEVIRLSVNEQILFYEGRNPVRAQKLCYYEDSEFKDKDNGENLFSPDPYIVTPKQKEESQSIIYAPRISPQN